MIVTITFPTEESQIPGNETPPPAGGYEGGARRILQKVAVPSPEIAAYRRPRSGVSMAMTTPSGKL